MLDLFLGCSQARTAALGSLQELQTKLEVDIAQDAGTGGGHYGEELEEISSAIKSAAEANVQPVTPLVFPNT